MIVISAIPMTLRHRLAQGIGFLFSKLRSQHVHLYITQQANGDPNRDNLQYLLPYKFHNFVRTLNIFSSQYSLAILHPITIQKYVESTRPATICPCPVIIVNVQGMYKYYTLLRYTTQSSNFTQPPNTETYKTCTLINHTTMIPFTYSKYIIYTRIHQNKFLHRWNEMQVVVTLTSTTQIHRSIHIPSIKNDKPHHTQQSSRKIEDTISTCRTNHQFINSILTL